MKNTSLINENLEVWFVTGSQHLYGEETLKTGGRSIHSRLLHHLVNQLKLFL